ncbi:peroxiredoxin-like family protein [uncultured Paraglaciecola sp.]|mgnify:CR=1 FL=1|uniref:peroxiredoxin-like family protein n=1 Tax=uncultured Paraglaciecola sp. TaxID=1765024 RepID=UPI0030D9FBBA|tara:strand:+ start:491586 stop:492224 length:639 start_codon:yes stop_codon:yes gene_type:complete
MKQPLLFIILILSIGLYSNTSYALDRTLIADSAENVTPLLIGQAAPNSKLQTAMGDPVSLKALTMQKPTVLIFYRGGWCPYCNSQLAGLKDIEGQLDTLGYQILAISPETPAQLQQQKLQTKFTVRLLSDPDLEAISGFGIGFYVPDATRTKYKSNWDISLNSEKVTGKAVLPAPAVFILDTTGKILFSYVNPDIKTRLSPELLYQAAKLSL